eukprot:gene2207-1374_t
MSKQIRFYFEIFPPFHQKNEMGLATGELSGYANLLLEGAKREASETSIIAIDAWPPHRSIFFKVRFIFLFLEKADALGQPPMPPPPPIRPGSSIARFPLWTLRRACHGCGGIGYGRYVFGHFNYINGLCVLTLLFLLFHFDFPTNITGPLNLEGWINIIFYIYVNFTCNDFFNKTNYRSIINLRWIPKQSFSISTAQLTMNDCWMLLALGVSFFVLYKYIIPYLFPSVVQGVSIIKPSSESEAVYAFRGGKVPLFNTEKRSHFKVRYPDNILEGFTLVFYLFLRRMSDEENRKRFADYVVEISGIQRNHISDKIEKLAHQQSQSTQYFLGCVGFSTGSVLLVFKRWGPRHIFKNSMYYARPLPPAISMGIVLYGILYTCRGMLMRNRICIMIEDYEYELKRIKAHHCKEGVTQLAWLEFVLDQVKQGSEAKFDIKKLRSPLV